jgi:hypothetical protein
MVGSTQTFYPGNKRPPATGSPGEVVERHDSAILRPTRATLLDYNTPTP